MKPNTENMNSTDLVTTKELAAILRVTGRTVYNLMKRGAIPRVRVGKINRFQPEQVIRALTEDASALGSAARGALTAEYRPWLKKLKTERGKLG